ncbi:MAG: LamG-like jellyroll fold domain-containing protein [Candidatus Limnocylindrales bacterium]
MGAVAIAKQPVYGLPRTGQVRSYGALVLGMRGLLGYWRLQEASGTTAADQLGVTTGTYHGTFTLGQPGPLGASHKSVLFDGSTAYVSMAAILANSAQRSAAAWVKSSSAQSSRFIWNEATGSTQDSLIMGVGPNAVAGGTASNLHGGMTGSNSSDEAGSTCSPLTDGRWHHVAVTVAGVTGTQWNPNVMQLYFDGMLVGVGCRSDDNYNGTSWSPPTVSVAGAIGAAPGGGSGWWTGNICELAVWGVALTAQQVSLLANATIP